MSVTISRDGRWMAASCYEDGTVRLLDLTRVDQRPVALVADGNEGGNSVWSISFSPDGRRLIAVGHFERGDMALLWDLTAEDPPTTLRRLPLAQSKPGSGYSGRSLLAISPDGRTLVAEGFGHAIQIWDLHAADPSATARELVTPSDSLDSLAITPDGKYLVTGDSTKVSVWELAASDLVRTERVLVIPGVKIRYLTTSPDGRWLVAAGDDASLRIFPLHVEDLIEKARDIVGRELTPDERSQYGLAPTGEAPNVAAAPSRRSPTPATSDPLGLMDRFMGRALQK